MGLGEKRVLGGDEAGGGVGANGISNRRIQGIEGGAGRFFAVGPFEVRLPKGHLPAEAGVGEVESVVLSDALRQLDYREHAMAFINKCPRDVLDEVTLRALAVVDPTAEFWSFLVERGAAVGKLAATMKELS